MATEMLGKVTLLEVDTANGTSYKTLVCLEDFELQLQAPVETTDTQCGQFNTVGTPGVTISFNGVANAEPTVSELSYEDVAGCVNSATKCSFRVQNAATGSVSAGAAFYHSFSGYFSSVSLPVSANGVVRFSGEIVSTGTIDLTA